MIVAGARTPIGKFAGAFKDVPAVTLGGHAIRAALERSGVEGKDVDYVIMGQVLQAGAGQITARQAAIEGGVPQEVPALTINKVCLSGLNAIALADQLIRAGEVEVVVAGGMESMSGAAVCRAQGAFRRAHGQRRDDRLDGSRRPVVDFHGAAHRRARTR